ncbi:hypothetical protein INR49_016031 [Caranx melampygus]|nr:hypothetical protein INR49_016031 [Caranx melampygus]
MFVTATPQIFLFPGQITITCSPEVISIFICLKELVLDKVAKIFIVPVGTSSDSSPIFFIKSFTRFSASLTASFFRVATFLGFWLVCLDEASSRKRTQSMRSREAATSMATKKNKPKKKKLSANQMDAGRNRTRQFSLSGHRRAVML